MKTLKITNGGAAVKKANGGSVNGGSEPIALDPANRYLYLGEEEVRLTPLEFRLLEVLLERSGDSLSRGQLLERVWHTDGEIETRTVDMHVARLRSKLGDARDMIETVHGRGYRLRIDPDLITA
jgi:two-component system phosphate regulon response regulator PhoB